ncbi:hypothetical protein [Streptomyces ipomoeae]|uniref:hypothetical protein n=1 Tax=Streptomyces ipomoeae TaxID=103232 RepID=UPI001319F38F|nr:hypothetical protein [Streptomyces ipomoeae]MDX2692987.1 hypothetical protein [Streptomyces ipomoeae]MDX2841699.1 hypothetical protein [Streptomyces ipomoeae]
MNSVQPLICIKPFGRAVCLPEHEGMSIWYRTADPIRAHWKRALFPVGFVVNVWSNQLYDTRHRAFAVVLFVCSLVLTLWSARQWRGFTESWHAPKQIRRWLIATFHTPAWIRRREKLKVVVWGVIAFKAFMYPLNLFDRIVAAPEQFLDHGKDALKMLAFCFLFPHFARWLEPKDNLLERLEGRVLRAMASRTLANFNGACGAAVLLYAVLSIPSRDYIKALPALAVTIGIATVVATHKMWTRYRKLCTQAHKNIQALMRALEQHPGTENQSVADAWETVELDLRTRVDTGYAFGMRFAPKAVIAALSEAVDTAGKGLPGHQEARDQALADLKIIRSVCAQRLDSVA